MVEPAVDAPLSPELVLVSPDLKARALVEDRIARPRPYLVPPLDEIVPLQAELVPEPIAPEPPAPVQQMPPPPPPEWHLTVGAATLIALASIVVFGIGLAVGRFVIDASTSESAAPSAVSPAPAPAPTATQTAAPTAPSVAATPAPARPTPASPPTPAAGSAETAVLPARLRHPIQGTDRANSNPVAAGFRPVPNGGYVLSGQRGRFRLSSDGRTILNFTLTTSCAGVLTLPAIDVGTTGTFAFAGHPGSSLPGTTVRVEGRFVSPAEARGTMQVSGSACRVPASAFVARLS